MEKYFVLKIYKISDELNAYQNEILIMVQYVLFCYICLFELKGLLIDIVIKNTLLSIFCNQILIIWIDEIILLEKVIVIMGIWNS